MAAFMRCMTSLIHDARLLGFQLQRSLLFSKYPESSLGLDIVTVNTPLDQQGNQADEKDESRSVLDSIFDSMVWAVQRNRRSLERRMTRRMQMPGHFEHAMPRNDIVVDLDTGEWKERGTICRKHYQRVKEETERMKEELGEAMQYTADQKEVVFLYHGEHDEEAKHPGKHVVKMKSQRPTWFPKHQLEKS